MVFPSASRTRPGGLHGAARPHRPRAGCRDPGGRDLHRRAGGALPRADRAALRRPGCLRHGDRRTGPVGSDRSRPTARRTTGRRPHCPEGPQRHRGGAHRLRLAGLRRLRAGLRRRGRTPHRGGRPGEPREDQHAGVRLALLHRARGAAPRRDPVGHRPDGRRLQRGSGGGCRGRPGAGGPGLRRWRLDPDPGQLLRTRRPQAQPGPDLRRSRVRRPRRPRDQRLAQPHRARCGGAARRDGRPRGR